MSFKEIVTVSFSINTNIASLEAQNYLRADSQFQSKTINEVTSGLRIVNSGDDAAGLAIANGLQATQAVLTQGIQNATNGLATLQTIDSGVNNISQLLDRAGTLAAESASGTFTGDRTVLNQEFQSVLTEVNRQAQSIGLNAGGTFAKNLSVFIGGGQAGNSTTAIQNGSVSINLANSTVDTQSLGLSGFSVKGASGTDIGTGAGATSVANIIADATNKGTETQAGYTTFYVTGSGYASNGASPSRIAVSVNLSGVTDANSLATAVNSAIQTAANGSTQQATAFKNAGIQASVYTDPTSLKSSLQFTSSTGAFQVEAGDSTANALLGNISSGSTGQAVAAATSITNVTAAVASTAIETINLGVSVGGTTTNVALTTANGQNTTTLLANLNTALSGANAGVTAAYSGGKLQFTATNANQAQSVSVTSSGDAANFLGLGTFDGTGGTPTYSTITAGVAAVASETQHVQIAVGNQVADLGVLNVGAGGETSGLTVLNNALQANAITRAAGITAEDNGAGKITLVSNTPTPTNFRVNAFAASGTHVGFGFGSTTSVDSSLLGSVAGSAQTGTGAPSLDANGTSTSGFLNFQGITIAGNSQTVALTAPDAAGVNHSISFSLSSLNASNIDAALTTINNQLLTSNDSTLQTIVAVKDQAAGANGADGIRFVSTLPNFTVSLGTTATGTAAGVEQGISNGTGAGSQGGPTIASSTLGTGSTADISSLSNALNAVTAITNAVTNLGRAQAAVGKGENLFNYASNLAQSQVTNDAAAESGIKDADLASEAANLSKAQILVQAGTAALAQANSAPQALLALLRG
jgi:flagellin